MDPITEARRLLTRRHFFANGAGNVAGIAGLAAALGGDGALRPLGVGRARRLIYLFMSGAPSQLDMWDPKPGLAARFDQELPDSIRRGQRITTMTSGQARFPVAPSIFRFAQHGQAGTAVSELLPYTAGIVDSISSVSTAGRSPSSPSWSTATRSTSRWPSSSPPQCAPGATSSWPGAWRRARRPCCAA
jgi:hypothetical protein